MIPQYSPLYQFQTDSEPEPEPRRLPQIGLKFKSNQLPTKISDQARLIRKKSTKGRLLTVEEGCGYSKVASTKIVGGSPAKNGMLWI